MNKRYGHAWYAYLLSAAVCALTTLIAALLYPFFDLANIVMLFLLTVVIVAVCFGRGPAILASLLSVAAFDFFFVAPRYSFAINDAQYLLTFGVMLAVALIIGQLAAGLKHQAYIARHRERRMQALYEMARDLSGTLVTEQIVEICYRFIRENFRAKASILLTDDQHRLLPQTALTGNLPVIDRAIAQWSFERAEMAGIGTNTLPDSPILYLPLKGPIQTRGVLAVAPTDPDLLNSPEQRRLLVTSATLIAIALERVHYANVAQATNLEIEAERLRNSLLATLSHDLRTPLTALIGLADSLTYSKNILLSPEQLKTATSIRETAYRMAALVNNLLDMARLQAGTIKLHRQWQPLEEIIGSALQSVDKLLAARPVTIQLPKDLPWLEFDAVLLERVLCNLLENAAKYTPAASHIVISARLNGDVAEISVEDDGPGIAVGNERVIFEKFTRGVKESAASGLGLGLAICQAVVAAHRGQIWAENRRQGGARFTFTLPLGQPPTVESADTYAG